MLLANGSTDVTTYFVLNDSVNHVPKSDITVTDLDLYYVEQGSAITVKADATALDAADSVHSDNKAFNVGQGLYRIDWPDEAFNGGIGKRVYLIVVCSGVDTAVKEVELSAPVDTGAVESIAAYFTDNRPEPSQGNPAASTTFLAKIDYLYKNWRNKKTQTATIWSLYNDAGDTVDQKATVSDADDTTTKTEIITGA